MAKKGKGTKGTKGTKKGTTSKGPKYDAVGSYC